VTDRRGEVHINPAVLVHRLPRPEGVAEKRELDILVIVGSIGVLAVHDPCLARMQFELAGLEPFSDAHRIVSIPGKPDARQMPRHPQIKRVVQEQIHQDRRRYALKQKITSNSNADLPHSDIQTNLLPALRDREDGLVARLLHVGVVGHRRPPSVGRTFHHWSQRHKQLRRQHDVPVLGRTSPP
jgi:hypothetical protein